MFYNNSEVKCQVMNGTLNNVDAQPHVAEKLFYNYNDQFSVNCTLGYVNYQDTSKTSASMTCGQSSSDKSKGVWVPEDYNACIGELIIEIIYKI